MPASAAKATLCGSTTTAPVSPARKSADKVWRLASGSHFRNGKATPKAGLCATKFDSLDMALPIPPRWLPAARRGVFETGCPWARPPALSGAAAAR